jgi:hypothetical protein
MRKATATRKEAASNPMPKVKAATLPLARREPASIETHHFASESEYLTDEERQELEQRVGHPFAKNVRRNSPLVYSFLLERKVERAEALSEEEIRTYRLAAKGILRLSDEEIERRLSGSLTADAASTTARAKKPPKEMWLKYRMGPSFSL